MAKYITQGTIKKIAVDTQNGGAMRIQLDPTQEFKIEACGKTAIALAETNENDWSVDLTKIHNARLIPVDQEFNIQNVSIAELISLKNNGNRVELRLDAEKSALKELVIL